MLLNYNFKMVFFPSKRLEYADGFSRLIPKPCEPLEETMITTLRLKIPIKRVLCNTIFQLPETIEEIRNKSKIDKIYHREKETNYQQTDLKD